MKTPIISLTFCLLVLSFAESLAENDCVLEGLSSPGDWRDDVSSSEKAKYLLDMELAASFMNIETCIASTAQNSQQEQANGAVEVVDAAEAKDKAFDASAEVASSGGEPSSAVEVGGVMIPAGEEWTKAGLVRDLAKRNATLQDDISETSDLPASKDELAAVLIEAIRIEVDPARRSALKERYKQLYGKNHR
ncbi:MAG TPA: hypothetical protein DCE52_18290 [Rhodobacteraceae bacterium]|nr:hypothetical protein [Pseudomonadales bacterium]MDC1307365.1 hypothetical protein [Pseudomonadales bacterium]HAB39918.1 hypothetical protein [Paracoccaceae bacterium]